MTKTLYVPDHVAASKNAAVASAYIEKNQKILDPSLVEKNLKERLPQPTGWRLLVMLVRDLRLMVAKFVL